MKVSRYPKTIDRSLQAYSKADEYILETLEIEKGQNLWILNDRFGFLSCHMASFSPTVLSNFASQEKAIKLNFEENDLEVPIMVKLLEPINQKVDIAILKVPKAKDMFEMFLRKIHSNSKADTKVLCAFMTRHFNAQLISISEKYFNKAEQSKAWKKSRLIHLSEPKQLNELPELIHNIEFSIDNNIHHLKQYYGVFSAQRIDYGTQFLIENLNLENTESDVLDLACGNGIIGYTLKTKNPKINLHLLDDSHLAIESSKLNIGENATYHFAYKTELIKDKFDIVVCNPPFHFEHEKTIDIAINLFAGVKSILKPDGRFVIVANRHLNYKTHLSLIFNSVLIFAENQKFIIYECSQKIATKLLT